MPQVKDGLPLTRYDLHVVFDYRGQIDEFADGESLATAWESVVRDPDAFVGYLESVGAIDASRVEAAQISLECVGDDGQRQLDPAYSFRPSLSGAF